MKMSEKYIILLKNSHIHTHIHIHIVVIFKKRNPLFRCLRRWMIVLWIVLGIDNKIFYLIEICNKKIYIEK